MPRRMVFDDEGSKRVTRSRQSAGSSCRAASKTSVDFDGRNKEVIDGLMSSGDIGHFDADGLLFVDGATTT